MKIKLLILLLLGACFISGCSEDSPMRSERIESSHSLEDFRRDDDLRTRTIKRCKNMEPEERSKYEECTFAGSVQAEISREERRRATEKRGSVFGKKQNQ